MPEPFTVRVHPTALQGIEDAVAYVSEHHSTEKAAEWASKIFDTIDSLDSMPDRCPLAPENGKWGDEELRQLLFQEYPSTYRILFHVDRAIVHVLQERHGARLWLHQGDK